MNPPPEPSRPPTTPPTMPHNAQNARFTAVHSIEAPQMYSKFPVLTLLLCSLYNFTASYPNTKSAIGNWKRKRITSASKLVQSPTTYILS